MKKKIFSKAFAIIGGLFVSLVLAVAPAKAVFIFATQETGNATATINVGDALADPVLSESPLSGNGWGKSNWLDQYYSLEGEGLENYSSFHWTSTASSNASGNADIDDAGDGDAFKVGYLTAPTTVVSGYATAYDGGKWPSKTVSKQYSALAPLNGLSATYTAAEHYHVGQRITFTINETVLSDNVSNAQNLFDDSYFYTLNGDQTKAGKVRVLYYWGTSATGTQSPTTTYGSETERNGINLCDMTHTAGSTTWEGGTRETLSTASSYYLRAAIYDEYTGLTSPWAALAAISPVYDIVAPAISSTNSFSSASTNSWALISQSVISITLYRPGCATAWKGHYRVGTAGYTTISYPATQASAVLTFTKQNLASYTATWDVAAYASCDATGYSSTTTAKTVSIPASVAAPSSTHTHAWNSGFFQWRADATWRNNSVYNLAKLRNVIIKNGAYGAAYGGYSSTNVAKDETFVPGTAAIGQNVAVESIGYAEGFAATTFGFFSYCQITYAGVTSKWYSVYCEHDTESWSPTTAFTDSYSITAKYWNNSSSIDFSISNSAYTTTTSYNG